MISHRDPYALPTLAPPPAGLQLRWRTYLTRDPAIRRDLISRCIVVAAGIVLLQWPLVVAGLLLFIRPYLRFRHLMWLMRAGSCSAAKVLSIDPPLVAVSADLSRLVTSSEPVVTVLRANLAFEVGLVETGDRIAVVGHGVSGTPTRWGQFEARVASELIDAPIALERVMADVPAWQWDDLDEALFGLEPPYRPGMFVVSQPGALV